MELRHLRYFVAVAEEGSLTVAAERRLHTAQPSLSRQMRDLEYEVGAQLMSRSVRGIELTAAGKAFLDHARLALAQVEAARDAARRAAEPAKSSFALGFLTGQEMDWLPEAMRILHDELPNMEVTVSSQYSPQLADASPGAGSMSPSCDRRRKLPIWPTGWLRRSRWWRSCPAITASPRVMPLILQDIVGETFIGVSNTAPALRVAFTIFWNGPDSLSGRITKSTIFAMAMSMIASTRGIAILPAYARNFMPWSRNQPSAQG